MISKKMEDAINKQINKEMYSAFLYMSMSAQATMMGLKGTARWLMVQYHEEMLHAMRFFEYIQRQNGTAKLQAIEEVPSMFSSALDIFEKTLQHEQYVTKSINDLMDLAISEHDHATQAFVAWYVTEQVEEEDNANEILQKLKMIGDNKGGLYMIDQELGARTVTVPTNFSMGVEAAIAGAQA